MGTAQLERGLRAVRARARRRPDGPEATRLGYLVGAMRRGASATQGIHDEMIRRV